MGKAQPPEKNRQDLVDRQEIELIYGHRHIELDLMLSATARVLILGDWINYFSYAVFDGENLFLEEFIEGETKL